MAVGNRYASFAEVLSLWETDPSFARAFSAAIVTTASGTPIFFECAPVTAPTVGQQPFECMLLAAPALAGMVCDTATFAEHWPAATRGVATFTNLGGSSLLVSPAPQEHDPAPDFTHLETFLRTAEAPLTAAFWAATAQALQRALAEAGVSARWLSTSGLGVGWTHMRVDQRPKYYTWRPYKI